MKEKKKLVVQVFTQPSGEGVYRACGRLNGKKIGKNFATRQEAVAEWQLLEIQAAQQETGMRVAGTGLDDTQLREAEAGDRPGLARNDRRPIVRRPQAHIVILVP